MKKDIGRKHFKAEQQLRDVINFLPDATFVIDKKGKVLIWNHAIEELTGLKSEYMIGKDNYEYSIPFYNKRRPTLADLILTKNSEIEKEYPILTRKQDAIYGEVFVPGIKEGGCYIWGAAKPLYNNRGEIIGAIESIRDITEQKETSGIITRQKDELQAVNSELSATLLKLQNANRVHEEVNAQLSEAREELLKTNELLKYSEEKFSKAFKKSPMVVSLSTLAEGRYIDVSDSFYENTGYTREDVIGHTAAEINIWADPSDRGRIIDEMKKNGKVRELEVGFRTKYGELRTKLFSADIVTVGGTQCLLAINADITDRKIAEQMVDKQKIELETVNKELKKTIQEMENTHLNLMKTQQELLASNERLRFSEEKFSKIVHLGPVIITLSKVEDGEYVEVSEYFLKLTGYSREEVIGRTAIDLKIWGENSDRDLVIGILRRDGVVRELDIHFKSRDGTIYLMRYSAEIITIAGKQHLVSVAIDITERKRVEDEKEKLEQQLLQSQKMETVGRLAGGIAHDFNNLLTAIMGNVELIMLKVNRENPIFPKLEMIQRASESASDLTKRILAFSRKQIIEPEAMDLNSLIDHMQMMLVRIIGENIKLHTSLNAEQPVIMADSGHIEQIVMNLAINARDAMPEGGDLTLETENVLIDELYCQTHAYILPGEYVALSVNDTGAGMSDEIINHLFEPFFTTKPKEQGTGLGLSIVYGAVKQNRGSIEVFSEVGRGSRFKIYFPIFRGEAAQADTSLPVNIQLEGAETVLLVEDNPMVLDFAATILKQSGYRVLEALNGEDAIKISDSYDGRIDLLITDVVLPGINGKVLAKEFKGKRGDIRVLYTSGYTENFIVQQDISNEGIQFISKPYSSHAILRKIREVLNRKE